MKAIEGRLATLEQRFNSAGNIREITLINSPDAGPAYKAIICVRGSQGEPVEKKAGPGENVTAFKARIRAIAATVDAVNYIIFISNSDY